MTPKSNSVPLFVRSFPGLAALIALAGLMVLPAGASAQIWTEVGDAGDLPATAQATLGTDPLVEIDGNLAFDADADMYCIKVLTPGTFVARLQCTLNFGPDLWLFDASGNGVAAVSQCSAGSKTITSTFLLGAGTYYVAVAYSGLAPSSALGFIWLAAISPERAPDGPGAAGPVIWWLGTPQAQPTNPYQILFTGAGFCDLPPVPVEARTWGRVKAMYN